MILKLISFVLYHRTNKQNVTLYFYDFPVGGLIFQIMINNTGVNTGVIMFQTNAEFNNYSLNKMTCAWWYAVE